MRQIITLFFLLACLPGTAQNIILPTGEYMDTTLNRKGPCAKAGSTRYYGVGGKYPRSSETLAQEAQAFLRRKSKVYKGNGYVTFRFTIDCAGFRQPMVQVLQTDAAYRQFHFRKELVDELYAFLKTLTAWRTATLPDGRAVNYLAYLTFKIKDGKVVAVVP
jgi:hypothetical protein